jgi:LysR family transcriptional regulator, benzoate and cis,cis-muconate-responsive activator of ben and cat genes
MTALPRLDHLRVKQLRFLGLLAVPGSPAATVEVLSMTPSAASMMLNEIEGLFGAKLFTRQGRGMAPTDAGRALLPCGHTVLGEVGAQAPVGPPAQRAAA